MLLFVYFILSFQAGRKSGWVSSFLAAFAGPAQGPRVDVPPPTTVAGSLPGIEGCTDKVCSVLPHGIWNRSCITNWNDRQLPKDGFHWENVKHLTVLLAIFSQESGAVSDLFCAFEAFNEYSLFLFPSRDTGRQTARTWYSCAHLMLARTFASALIPCGIAAFFSCFPPIPAQTLELSDTTARLCACCGSMMQLHPVLNDSKFF